MMSDARRCCAPLYAHDTTALAKTTRPMRSTTRSATRLSRCRSRDRSRQVKKAGATSRFIIFCTTPYFICVTCFSRCTCSCHVDRHPAKSRCRIRTTTLYRTKSIRRCSQACCHHVLMALTTSLRAILLTTVQATSFMRLSSFVCPSQVCSDTASSMLRILWTTLLMT